ncbi:hypothetical protein N9W32_04470, partial [Flavobacteriaceae bacterium]|nr:hypothetical protein [Flavobacteriaceae bacterium]
LMTLFLLFIQSTQAKTKLTGNFLINNTISSIPLEREEGIIYNNKSEKEGDVTSISNDSKNTSKNSTFREVANDDFKSIEETNNTTQLHYIVEQEFTTTLYLENIEVANQPFPNPDTDGDGVNDDIDLDDDNDGILDTVENGYEEYCIDNNYNSGYYEYIVPSGVSNLSVTLQGGKGGNGGNDVYNAPQDPQGAPGQTLKSTITVIPGSTLEIYVGGDGIDGIQSNQGSYTSQGGTNLLGGLFNGGRGGQASTNGGWSGHGGGGGAATVMRVPQSNGTYIEYVAAGGGGGGGQGASSNGTDGGLCSSVSSGSGNGANDPNDGGGGGGGGGGLLRGNGGAVDEPGDRGADGGCNGSNYFPGSSVVTALSGTKVSICIVDIDKDNDGLISSLDLDSDGDGIPDNIEAQSTAGFTVPASDNAATYTTNNGLNSSYSTSNGITPIDTDGDGLPDFIDLDSDNAQTDDTTELLLTVSNNDSDNDGLDDNNDSNDSVYGPADAGITDPLIAYEDNGQEINSRAACENGTTDAGLCILYEGRVFEDSGIGAGGIFGDCIENGDENSLNLPDGLYANVVQGSTLVYSSLLDSSGNYQIPHLEDGNYEIVITTDPLSTSVSLPNLYSFGANGWYFISVVNDVVTSPSSIPTICIQSCEFGKISTEQYVISATGNANTGWGQNDGVIGAPDEIGATGTTANRISLRGINAPITLTYQDTFTGGATITFYGRHWDSNYVDGFTIAFSEDNSTWTSESSSQNIGSTSYTTLNYTIPNNFSGNYKYIR